MACFVSLSPLFHPSFFPCRCQGLWKRSRAATLSFALAEMCVVVCCSVLQCVAVCSCVLHRSHWLRCVLQCVAVCCSVLQCVAWFALAEMCVAVCCSSSCDMPRCMGEACCSVLHEVRVAVCCSSLCDMPRSTRKMSQQTEQIHKQLRLPESFGPNHESFFLSLV